MGRGEAGSELVMLSIITMLLAGCSFIAAMAQPVIWESWVMFLALPRLDSLSLSCHNYAGSLRTSKIRGINIEIILFS